MSTEPAALEPDVVAAKELSNASIERLSRVVRIVWLVLLLGCAPPYSQSPPENLDEFAREDVAVIDGRSLHYIEAGTPGKPLVVFVHGTPGSWHAFRVILRDPQLATNAHMIAVDRLGFGRSAATGPQPLFQIQARAISKVFENNQSTTRTLVVGHSLGGSIGFRLAIDYPDAVGALLAISATVSPELGRPRWYNRFADLPVVKWLVPEELKFANVEIMSLRDELEAMETQFRFLPIPISIIQGSNDKLVSPENADYVEKTMVHAPLNVIRCHAAGHSLIWLHPEIVVTEILRLIGEMERSSGLSNSTGAVAC